MASRARMIRTAAAIALAIGALVLTAGSARATFHLMKMREVATNPAGPDSSYVELQMYALGPELPRRARDHGLHIHRLVAGHSSTFPPSPGGDVANGDNQRTVLVGDTATPGSPDYVDPVIADFLSTISAGGAVCWENIDCVSWGGFTGAGRSPSPPGTPAAAIPNGSALVRSIAPNCPTLLENADDTNNSSADFSIAPPAPRNNSVAPTETACSGNNRQAGPDTSITEGPKKKTKKKKAKFEFSSTTPGASFMQRRRQAVRGLQLAVHGQGQEGQAQLRGPRRAQRRLRPSPAKQNWKVKKPK